ncbi:MAG: nucleotidyltransferase family protein [Pseudomonadota bacterium]
MAFTAIVMAGARPGEDPVALHYGESCKAFARVGGTPMLARVIQALSAAGQVDRIVIVGDSGIVSTSGETLLDVAERATDLPVRLVASGETISASLQAAVAGSEEGQLFFATTCDHALLTKDMVSYFLSEASNAGGLVVGVVSRDVIEGAFPGMKRTYWRFRDNAVSGANLFAFTTADVAPALGFFERMQANRKRPLKVVAEFGYLNVIRMALRRVPMSRVFEVLSEKFGVKTTPILLPMATAAVDVDKIADIQTVEALLKAA